MYTTSKNDDAVSPVIGVIVTALLQFNPQLDLQQDFYDGTDGRHYSNLGGSHSSLRIRNVRINH